MKKLQAWLNAFRLRTLPLAFSSIITGSALACKHMHTLNVKVFVLSLITTLLLQVLANLANDYGDSQKGTDNDDRIGPKRAIQSGILSFTEVKYGIISCAVLALLCGVALIAEASEGMSLTILIFFLLLGLSAIAAAIQYTVGRHAYGYQGLGDMFVVLFFGWVGVEGSYYLQTKEFSAVVLLPANTIGFLAATVLHLNNMRDRVSDEKSGKITMAVRLGFKKSKLYFYWLNFIAFSSHIAFCLWTGWGWWQCFLSALPLAVLFITCLKVCQVKQPQQFDPLLKVNAWATFFLSLSVALV